MKKTTMSSALAAAAVAAAAILATAPLASADVEGATTTTPIGSQAKLDSNNVVQGWTVSNLKPSTDSIDYPVRGTLWEATASGEALQGSVVPVVSNFNARTADGHNYRALFQVATPEGVNPGTLAQGQTTSGKIYFDATDGQPSSVVYNAGGTDLLTWSGTPAAAPVADAPAEAPVADAPAEAPAADAPAEAPVADAPAEAPVADAPDTAAAGAGSDAADLPEAATDVQPASTEAATDVQPASTEAAVDNAVPAANETLAPEGTAPAGTDDAATVSPASEDAAPAAQAEPSIVPTVNHGTVS